MWLEFIYKPELLRLGKINISSTLNLAILVEVQLALILVGDIIIIKNKKIHHQGDEMGTNPIKPFKMIFSFKHTNHHH